MKNKRFLFHIITIVIIGALLGWAASRISLPVGSTFPLSIQQELIKPDQIEESSPIIPITKTHYESETGPIISNNKIMYPREDQHGKKSFILYDIPSRKEIVITESENRFAGYGFYGDFVVWADKVTSSQYAVYLLNIDKPFASPIVISQKDKSCSAPKISSNWITWRCLHPERLYARRINSDSSLSEEIKTFPDHRLATDIWREYAIVDTYYIINLETEEVTRFLSGSILQNSKMDEYIIATMNIYDDTLRLYDFRYNKTETKTLPVYPLDRMDLRHSGGKVAYTSNFDQNTIVYDYFTGEFEEIKHESYFQLRPDIDSNKVVWQSNINDQWDIYMKKIIW